MSQCRVLTPPTALMHPSHQLIRRWVANDSVCATAQINNEICSRFSLMTRAVIKVANKSVGVEPSIAIKI